MTSPKQKLCQRLPGTAPTPTNTMANHLKALHALWDSAPAYSIQHARTPNGGHWSIPELELTIIATVELHALAPWLHVSFSCPDITPPYAALALVRRHWIGVDRKAVMVFPSTHNYVDIHPHCLHLHACLSPAGDGLPELNAPAVLARPLACDPL